MCQIKKAFVQSHLKRAIWDLECAVKLQEQPDEDLEKIIEDLKVILLLIKTREE